MSLAAVAVLGASTLSAAAGTTSPNDPFFTQGDQWALTGAPGSINAPGAWAVATGYGVTVADVDTGANFAHPDLAGKLVAGAQFLSCPNAGSGALGSDPPSGMGQSSVQDDVGHGSMTTGIAVAGTNNGQGIAAVAPDARALVVKVLSRSIQYDSNNNPQYAYGSGCDNDIGAGIEWAVDHGAQVINLSIGSEVPLTGTVGDIVNAISYAWNHDVAVAVAAGNNQLPVSDYATISSDALVVGALGPSGSTASYSTRGAGVNLWAPGGDSSNGTYTDEHHLIVSTSWPDPQFGGGEYAKGEGTSFAAPQAAGVLALLRSCGLGGQAAVQRVKSVAANHGNHLDAAATLAGLSGCAAPAGQRSSGSGTQSGGRPGPGPGGGGAPASGATAAPSGGGATATRTTPTAAPATPTPQSGVAGADGTTPGAGSNQPPAASAGGRSSPGGGGSGGILLLIVLGAVILVGAPAAAWLARAMRQPPPA